MVFSTSAYKVIGQEGFLSTDYTLLRNCISATFAILWLLCLRINPIKMFPWDKKFHFAALCLTGQATFFLLKYTAPMAPISLIMIIR